MSMFSPLSVTTIATAIAPLAVVADENGVVLASGFGTVETMLARLPAPVRDRGSRDVGDLGDIGKAVEAYLDGDLTALDLVAVTQPGSAFSQSAWQAMREVRPGTTVSYSELATRAGRAGAARAAGSACARNLVAPFVPCHRVVSSDGSLGGYEYGLVIKDWLLTHERTHSG